MIPGSRNTSYHGVLKLSSKRFRKVAEGDIIAMELARDSKWLFGRIISTGLTVGPWRNLSLIYIFKYLRDEPIPPEQLLTRDLLLPPLMVGSDLWSSRYVTKVGRRPLAEGERLDRHLFWDERMKMAFVDGKGRRVTDWGDEPLIDDGVTLAEGVDHEIGQALGIEMRPPELPDQGAMEGAFDNDVALDWICDLDRHGYAAIKNVIGQVISESDRLEAPLCQEALAAAEVVAALYGRAGLNVPEEVARWVQRHPASDQDLAQQAYRAVDRILTDSELRELWEENEQDYPKWRALMEDLLTRLASAKSPRG